MSHIFKIPPKAKSRNRKNWPVTIKSQPLLEDLMQLAKLYRMAFPTEDIERAQYQLINLSSHSLATKSITEAALSFFIMIEEKYFPLEHMREWHNNLNEYNETIKPWLYDIPVKVIGLDWGLEPKNMNEPQALLMRLASVGNYSKQAEKHKQVLMFEYQEWEWDGLLDTFKLYRVIPALFDADPSTPIQ